METFRRIFLKNSAQRDVAFLIFSEQISEQVMPLDFRTAKVGSAAEIVGFGLDRSVVSGRTKRKAQVEIKNIPAFQSYLTTGTPSINQGDSGGPIIVDGSIVGIASSTSSGPITPDRYARHANLSHPDNLNLMHRAVKEGAVIPGLLPLKGESVAAKINDQTYVTEFDCNRPTTFNFCNGQLTFAREKVEVSIETVLEQSFYFKQDGSTLYIAAKKEDLDDPKTSMVFSVKNGGLHIYDAEGRRFVKKLKKQRSAEGI